MAGLSAREFVICIRNDDYPASLETRKVYEVLPDVEGERHGQLRVRDESGEDYLYPSGYFVRVTFSEDVAEALGRAR